MHTILGAGGPVGNALAQTLTERQETVRLVSRRKVDILGAEWVHADIKDVGQTVQATQGSSVIYMCAGLRYDRKVWAEEWPLIMKNLIHAVKTHGPRLIFFDNVYMYGRSNEAMTENSPYNPSSVKGRIRAEIAEQLMREALSGNIRASIARAADFYGVGTFNSFLDSMVLSKYAKKQKAMWLGNPHAKHSFTFIPDTGKALYALAKNPESDNQVWHLPTAPALTGIELLQMATRIFNTAPRYMRINKFLLNSIGLFNKTIGEAVELYYQNQYDYVFSSEKFEKAFGMQPTSYEEGIRRLSETIFKS